MKKILTFTALSSLFFASNAEGVADNELNVIKKVGKGLKKAENFISQRPEILEELEGSINDDSLYRIKKITSTLLIHDNSYPNYPKRLNYDRLSYDRFFNDFEFFDVPQSLLRHQLSDLKGGKNFNDDEFIQIPNTESKKSTANDENDESLFILGDLLENAEIHRAYHEGRPLPNRKSNFLGLDEE